MEQAAVKFNGENWATWKFQTVIILRSKGLLDVATGIKQKPEGEADGQAWEQQDAKAQEIIAVRMEEKPLTHIISCRTAGEMWEKLMSIYEHKSQVSIHLLQQKFFNLEFKAGNVADFISQLEEIKQNLKHLGEELSDKMVITKILMSLPENMKHFVSAWESTESKNQNLKELTSRLLIEEERLKQTEQVTALAANKRSGKFEIKCFICHKPGHIKRNCPERGKSEVKKADTRKYCSYCKKQGHFDKHCWFKKGKSAEKASEKEEKVSNAFISVKEIEEVTRGLALTGDSKLNSTDWCMDSGASDHMCCDEKQFTHIDYTLIKSVELGDGSVVQVKGVGKVDLEAWNGQDWLKTELNEVLYIPEFKINLFSVGKALDRGFKLISDKNKSEIVDQTGAVRAVAQREHKVFKMTFRLNNKNDNYFCHRVETLESWHNKLAHVNFNEVRAILKKNNIKYKENEKPICEDCIVGKQHKLPFNSSESRANKIGQLIHTDLCGPFEEESIGGAKYFLLLKDDYSNFKAVFFLKHKTETKQKIGQFIKYLETQTGNKVLTLRSDNGLEFVNNEMNEMLSELGIKHERTCPYTPQQNGRADRENRTLVEAARTMLNKMSMSKKFWAEAINTAVFIMNRVVVGKNTGKTPYQLWYQKDFDISFLKNFGCTVAVHVSKEKRQKLDSKSKKGFLVGYSEEIKGYRIYFPNTNKVEIHRDVIIVPENEESKTQGEVIMTIVNSENNDSDDNESSNLSENKNINSNSDEEKEEVSESETKQNVEVNRSRVPRRPRWMDDYETSFFTSSEEPMSYEEAISGNNASKWNEAMEKELRVLKRNNTWTEVKWPVNKKVINSSRVSARM